MKTNRPTFRSDEYADDSPDISAQKPFKGSDPYRHVAVAYSPGEEVIPIGVRVGRNQLEKYNEELSTRDREILASLKKCKFLLTGQIQRLHITNASTQKAARRAAARELRKLKDYGLVNTLERRIGGTRAGYLENLAAQIEDDLCIAPSSIHEVLIFPLSLVQPARIIEIVRDVNRTVVLPQEQLSDSAYIYRRGTHTISQATLKNPDDSTCEQND